MRSVRILWISDTYHCRRKAGHRRCHNGEGREVLDTMRQLLRIQVTFMLPAHSLPPLPPPNPFQHSTGKAPRLVFQCTAYILQAKYIRIGQNKERSNPRQPGANNIVELATIHEGRTRDARQHRGCTRRRGPPGTSVLLLVHLHLLRRSMTDMQLDLRARTG